MGVNREKKTHVIGSIAAVFAKAKSVAVARYHGVNVASIDAIRVQARSKGVYLHVLKNTLVIKAIQESPFAPLIDYLKGPLIYSISEDFIDAAKVVGDFVKNNPNGSIVAGMCEGRLLDAKDVVSLANTPSREQSLSMLVGVMQQIPASFVRCVAAIRDQKAA